MKIRGWHCYIVINCALVIPCLLGKPVSLNALIAAENQKNQSLEPSLKTEIKGLIGKPASLNAIIAAEKQKNHAFKSTSERKRKQISEDHFGSNEQPSRKSNKPRPKTNTSPLLKQISSLKGKRSDFDSKTRLKPKDLLSKLRKKRKSKSNKREIVHHEDMASKYSSVLSNLGKLFDKVLHNDAGTASKLRKGKLKHNKFVTERDGMVCTCKQKFELERPESFTKSQKKAAPSPKTSTSKVSPDSETSSEAATDTAVGNLRSIRPNKNLPLLLSRNPLGSWRNHNGHSKRSSTAFYGDLKRNITRNNGNGKYDSRNRENESNTESYEEDTFSAARHGSSSNGFRRGDRNDTRNTNDRKKADKDIQFEKNEDSIDRSNENFERQAKFKTRGNETRSEASVPEYAGGLRRHVPEDQIGANTEPIQSKEVHEKSNNNVTLDRTNDQRISGRSSPVTTETEDASTENITVISIQDLSNLTLALQSAPKGNLPVVTIFGGYSVAKDINGQNKLSEQTIHIHS